MLGAREADGRLLVELAEGRLYGALTQFYDTSEEGQQAGKEIGSMVAPLEDQVAGRPQSENDESYPVDGHGWTPGKDGAGAMQDLGRALRQHTTTLAVWGLGYIGYSSLASFARRGVSVIGIDVDPRRVEDVTTPGHEVLPHLHAWLGFDVEPLIRNGSITATTQWRDLARRQVAVHLVAVPTERAGSPWPDPLVDVLTKIFTLHRAAPREDAPLVIVESTTVPGWFTSVVAPVAESTGVALGTDILLGVAPRRDWFGEPSATLQSLPRVIGGTNERATRAMADVLGIVSDTIVPARDHVQAALTKVIENAYRHLNISFANELSAAFPDVNIREVLELAGTKWNVETYRPSLGIGGYCIPVAPRYVLEAAGDRAPLTLLRGSLESEASQPCRVAAGIVRRGARAVGILGISYRGDVRIHVSSPALRLAELLGAQGVAVRIHDPGYTPDEIAEIAGVPSFDFPEGLRSFDVVVVSTAHAAYRIPCERVVACLRPGAVVLDNDGAWRELAAHTDDVSYYLAGDPGWLGDVGAAAEVVLAPGGGTVLG